MESPHERHVGAAMPADAEAARADAGMRFTVVVPTYNRRDAVVACLRSMAELQAPWPCEVVVVVDGSTDGSVEAAGAVELPFPLRVLSQSNAGAAAARNLGAAQARGEVLLFLDDDMVVAPNLLLEHDRVLRQGADAVVGHIPLHPDSPPSVLTAGVERWARRRLDRLRAAGDGDVALADLLTGQLSVRADVFRAAGGFDPAFTAGGTFGAEDTDFLYRLVRDGARVRAAPEAVSWQRYVVTPAAHLRQWRQGGRADAVLVRKHPELAPALVRQHHGTGVVGRLLRAAAAAPEPLTASVVAPVLRLTDRGRTDRATTAAFGLLRDVQYWSGAREAGGLDNRCQQMTVLAYHAIEDVADPATRQYSVPPHELEAQVRALLADGYRFVDADAYLAHLRGAPAAPRSVLLTFDDAYRSVLTGAAPILDALGVPAVVFAVTQEVGGTNAWDVRRGALPLPLMDRGELETLVKRGWELGSHSRSHAHLAALDGIGLAAEVAGSRDDLVRLDLPRPRLFAYPYGEHHFRVRRAVRAAGYAAAFALDGTALPGSPFALRRVEIQRGERPEALLGRLAPAAGAPSLPQARRELRGAAQLLLGRGRSPREGTEGA